MANAADEQPNLRMLLVAVERRRMRFGNLQMRDGHAQHVALLSDRLADLETQPAPQPPGAGVDVN